LAKKRIVGVTGEIESQSAVTQLGELSMRLAAGLEARVKEKPSLVSGLNRASFREARSSLRIVSAHVDTVLPSRLGVYAKEGLVSLRVQNRGKSRVDEISARVFIPKLMSLPSETSVGSLPPGAGRVVAATATLDADAIGRITEQAPVQVSVEIRGRQGDASRRLKLKDSRGRSLLIEVIKYQHLREGEKEKGTGHCEGTLC